MSRPPKIRNYLRTLGNPYASLQVEGVGDIDVADAAEARREAYHRSENPYALHFYTPNVEADPGELSKPQTLDSTPVVTTVGLSQAEFEARARAIFRSYIPAVERGRLRPHHREFILRNKVRPAPIRSRLIGQLQRYDISGVAGLQPMFNREDSIFTSEKLHEIERLVGDDP